MAKKYKPFISARQSSDWIARNCDTCKKGFDKKARSFLCNLERGLCLASLGILINEDTAKAIGFLDSEGADLWECPGWERGRG